MPPKIKEPPAHYRGSIIEWKALSTQSRHIVTNKDKLRAKASAYREANKVKIDAKRKANKDKLNAKASVYREANKDKINAKANTYREATKDKRKVSNAALYQLNRDTRLEQHRNYKMKKANEFYELFGTYEIEPGIY